MTKLSLGGGVGARVGARAGTRVGALAGALIGAVALALLPFVLPQFWIFFVAQIMVWIMLAQSFNLLFGYTGLLSLGQSAYFTLGAYGLALLLREVGLGLPLLLIGGVLAGLIGAALIGYLAVRVQGHGFIIVTAVPTILLILFGQDQSWLTGGDNGINLIPPKLFGVYSFFKPATSYYVVLPLFLLVIFAIAWLIRTPLGRAFRLIRENEERASILGYNVLRLKYIAFVIAGGIAGLAGALDALITAYVVPNSASWTISADAIIWTLVGGAGTLLGPIVGTALLLLLREFLSDIWAYGYPLLLGITLLFIVRFAPNGIIGELRAWTRS